MARRVKAEREQAGGAYRIIPIRVDGAPLGLLETLFGDEKPLEVRLHSGANGIFAALPALRAALGQEAPSGTEPGPRADARPMDELVLELTDLSIHVADNNVRRPRARARLVYQPADPARPAVHGARDWRLTAPLGPIEADDLAWYLEKYPVWPGTPYQARARQVEQDLIRWGRLLHDAALPAAEVGNVLDAWEAAADGAARRFSVQVDARPLAGTDEAEQQQAREAATALLALPWELLHDGRDFLFQGRRPVRVRRRLPGTRGYDRPLLDPPIRILVISPRPEDAACGYIDHRASTLPLLDAVADLGELVVPTLLDPPTLPALRQALAEARDQGRPYHVIHFDGHGVYDRRRGLGGLCFEDPADLDKLEGRRHQTIDTDQLGPLLEAHRIPLVFLEACQSAQAEAATDSVATALLQAGVAGVVAMTHSVLVETARRFVRPFYVALASSQRIGDAMLKGQQALKDDDTRGQVFGAGPLRLQDWFVPVLYQEQDDPRLFTETPAPRTVEEINNDLARRLGELPPPPETRFIGRSRELLALERLLGTARWALIRGQGGEGKTALACELARWRVRTGRCRRAAFVSVEQHSTATAVLDALGRQLVPGYSVTAYPNLDQARQPIERALRDQPTILVLDNLESLLPRDLDPTAPASLVEAADQSLAEILALAARLHPIGETRLLLTSREPLPAPFDRAAQRRELHRLAMDDAVALIEKALNAAGTGLPDAEREAVEALVEAVQGHARTLALLVPNLRAQGVEATRTRLVALMEAMDRQWPGERERSLYASVELSLARLTPEQHQRARGLGVFQGSVDVNVLMWMMDWDEPTVTDLAQALTNTGLATPGPYGHLALNPALCPYLLRGLEPAERADLLTRWDAAMGQYVAFLVQQHSQDSDLSATLTRLELANLLALLDRVEAAATPEATIALATSLHQLFQMLGRPRLLQRIARARDAAERTLTGSWSHAAFTAQQTRIEQQLDAGQLQAAFDGARGLLERAVAAGDGAYPDADYDLGLAHILLARVLNTAGDAEQALPLLDAAQDRFEAIARAESNRAAERMASVCVSERGECLLYLGRLDEAAAAYEEAIRRAEALGDARQVAVGKGQLGTVRLRQGRLDQALAAYAEARERFEALGEPGTVAVFWHQTGMALQEAGRGEAAEDAHRQSLAIAVRLGNRAGQADTLNQLGNLYLTVLDRPEEAVALYRQAAEASQAIGDLAKEGAARNNLAVTLRRLERPDEARRELLRAIDCKAPFGHAAEPWKTWDILCDIETDAGNPAAAGAARAKARAAFLAYRRDGGENQWSSGRLALAVGERLANGQASAAEAELRALAARPDWSEYGPFLACLTAIAQGRRDPALAETAGLSYDQAAEILLLLERLPPPAAAP
jgi:tetratricopeptide (TPR) repeat protein